MLQSSSSSLSFLLNNQSKSRANSSPLIPGAHLIETLWKRQYIIGIICKCYGLSKILSYNPSPQPVSLSLSDLPLLQEKNSYLVTEKTDGMRYLMLLTRYNGNKEPVCVMINRKYDMYEIPVICSEAYFNDTLVDGELVWEYESMDVTVPPRQLYYVFDIVACAGESFITKKFPERIQIVKYMFDIDGYDILQNPRDWVDIARLLAANNKIISEGNQYALQFRPKQFHSLNEIETIWKNRNMLRHCSDGLVFMPITQPIKIGTDWTQFKWKPHNTIDLLWKCQYVERPSDYPVYINKQQQQPQQFKKNQVHLFKSNGKTAAALQLQQQQQNIEEKNNMIWKHELYYFEKSEKVNATIEGITLKDPKELDESQSQTKSPYRQVPMTLIPSKYINELIHWHEQQNIRQFEYIVECECRLPSLSEYFEDLPIIECIVLKLRLDKLYPNNRYTVERTLMNCQENITIRMLIENCVK